MDFEIVNGAVASLETECLVIGVEMGLEGGATLSPSAQALDQASQGYLSDLIKNGDIKGKTAESLLLQKISGVSAKRILLVGLGKADERHERNYKKVVKAILGNVKALSLKDVVIALDGLASKQPDTYRQVRLLAEWTTAELYQYDQTKSKKADIYVIEKVAIHLADDVTEEGEGALVDGSAIANGMNVARDLGNLPGNICTPIFLAEQAKELANEYVSITCEILDEDAMENLGMGSLLSVGRGSAEPSRLIIIKHNGGEADAQPYVIVGKGVTFDTGGISLKPGAKMDEMKYDMCGSASVMGTMHAIAEMDLPINVIGVIAAAENMPGSKATKPGDIVTSMSGQTIEVLNTDAEGRLVLCDALTYVERFNPKTVVDIATLTGAVIGALGNSVCGLLTNDEELASELSSAGDYANDCAWRLPLLDEYQELLDSNFADIANIGGPTGGAITAACFLSRFTKAYRWAHLDIAGTAWLSGGKEKGATGRCVPLLSQYLLNQAADEMTDDE
ncbi:leucyl aminopeptidase [Neptunomonas antarctica]|uniref:Probable cytosol aminopeptidase n=1 Tax=Neptunomonas antarctica TaxID=619304 RepID=A0A1N7P9C2_9GAMM|nr:leucyl aminopeptidase [Neptunomonas antarctica]SIT07181.1 aminopeptidase A. Metallo peptidase. MEROPS family M17 [Neptunomonas antarctica]